MEYLLDTTTISYLLEKERRVSRRFNRLLLSDQAYPSVISEAELIYGALRLPGARGRNLHDEITDLLDRLDEVLPISRQIAQVNADLKRKLAAEGRAVPVNDLWIGAVAVSRDLTLVAHDKDFESILGLRLEDWLA
jgi:predicted nucleic acid-binding protein